ncbi:hypothetical protein M422DRAFT_243653 [Sphaerobolus stellatus SS14]|nr:hypothetical protein M422DRAFT_243653 [Sphaerobolus stellatus SS14]
MAPKKKTSNKVPTGTSDAVDSSSMSNVAGGNDPTLDPGKDPSQVVSAASETNTIRPTTRSTHVTNQLVQPASERGTSEDPTQTPNPHGGSGDPLLPKTYSDYSEPSERLASADPDPKELALGDQIQEMLDTINEHMDEVKTIHNISHQVAQLLGEIPNIAKDKSSIHSRDSTKDPNNEDIDPHSEQPVNWSNNYVDEELTNGQPNVDPELIQSTDRSNNRSGPKDALGKSRTELLAKTAVLEWLYADQAPADHLNQAAMAARSTRMEYNEDAREAEIRDKTRKSVRYAPFDGIEDNDTDSETTVGNHWEGSVPFQHLDDRDILDMSNNKDNNPLVRMVKYTGLKVTPPDKYSGEQSFEALETFVKGTRLEGKALEWFDKTVKPRKYQGTPMDLGQVMTGLYGQYIPSLARREASNKFDFIKQGTLSMQEFATELELYVSRMGRDVCYYAQVKLEDANRYDIGLHSSEPTTSNSRRDNNVSSNTRRRPRNNGPDRTKSRADPPKLGEINKGPSINPRPSGVNRNSSTAPGGAGTPIINRQRTNHESSHNSIECCNCGKSGHIKPNCPEPLRARRVGAVHVEDSPTGQVNNTDLDINDPIDDERPDEDEYHNEDYDNQPDLSEDQRSWGSKPIRYSHTLARVAAVIPIGPANTRKAKIAKEGEPLYDHTVKMKTTRPAQSKHDLLTITGYFLVGGTKARCLFDSGCEGIIMSSEFVQATGLCMHKLPEPIGIQQAFQGRTPFLRRVKANIDLNGLGSIVINGEMIANDLSVWLALEEAKIHGMSANKATLQEEEPLEPIAEQLSCTKSVSSSNSVAPPAKKTKTDAPVIETEPPVKTRTRPSKSSQTEVIEFSPTLTLMPTPVIPLQIDGGSDPSDSSCSSSSLENEDEEADLSEATKELSQ